MGDVVAFSRNDPRGHLLQSTHGELEAWLASIPLRPHQRPIAATALRLARIIDDPDQFTAAAVEQLRRILLQLIPADAHKHKSQTNAERIKKAPAKRAKKVAKKPATKRKTKVDDAKNAKPANARPRTGKRGKDAGVSTPSVAERIRTGGA